jgi:hypothetical protein
VSEPCTHGMALQLRSPSAPPAAGLLPCAPSFCLPRNSTGSFGPNPQEAAVALCPGSPVPVAQPCQLTLHNTIVWDDSASTYERLKASSGSYKSGVISASYSNIKGGSWAGANGNLKVAPNLTSSYSPEAGSAMVNAGDPNGAANADALDLLGNPRVSGGCQDIGAAEYQQQSGGSGGGGGSGGSGGSGGGGGGGSGSGGGDGVSNSAPQLKAGFQTSRALGFHQVGAWGRRQRWDRLSSWLRWHDAIRTLQSKTGSQSSSCVAYAGCVDHVLIVFLQPHKARGQGRDWKAVIGLMALMPAPSDPSPSSVSPGSHLPDSVPPLE